MADFKKEVEAILFSAGRTVLVQEFCVLLGIRNPGLIKETVKELKGEYEARDSPLMIIEEGEGWKLTVKERFLQVVQRINPHTELSKTILETLSVIAWKQPALQSDVIKIRTNKAYDHIAELERLGFIAKDKHGRSFSLKVTQKFLDYFDLPDSAAIKGVFKEFKDIESAVQKKVDEFSKEQLKLPEVSEQKVESKGLQEQAANEEKQLVVPFSDELPEMQKPKRMTDLEVYELAPEVVNKAIVEEKQILREEPKEDKESVNIKSIQKQKKEETPEEKTRRIARELLAEDMKVPQDDEEPEEKHLHPKLEEFIAGVSAKKKKPVLQEDTVDEVESDEVKE